MLLRKDVYGIVSQILYGRAGDKVTVIKSSLRVDGGQIHIVEGEHGRFSVCEEDLTLQDTEVSTEPEVRIIQQAPARKQKKAAAPPPAITNQQSFF